MGLASLTPIMYRNYKATVMKTLVIMLELAMKEQMWNLLTGLFW